MEEYEHFHCVPHAPGVECFKAAITRRSFPLHTHEGFVVGVVHRGTKELTHFGDVHRVCTETVVFLNPDELHAVRAVDEVGAVYQTLHIPARLFHAAGGHGFKFKRPVERAPELSRRLALGMDSVCTAINPEQAIARLSELIHQVVEFQALHAPQHLSIAASGIQHLFEHIEQNINRSLSVNGLARRFEVTPQHLIRVFKQATGVTPHAYIQARRTALAKQLLRSYAPIDAAISAGFSDQSHLTRWMKACHGITPAVYRKTVERLVT